MRYKGDLIKTEYSVMRDLSCYQQAAGKTQVNCQWVAEPPAPFYEIVFSMTDGSEILRKTVRSSSASVELGNFIGNVVSVSARNISLQMELLRKSMNHLFGGIGCKCQSYSVVICHDPVQYL